MTLAKRSEVPTEKTWSVETVFANPADWRVALEKLPTYAKQIAAFSGRLSESGGTLFEAMQLSDTVSLEAYKVDMYASLLASTEGTNTGYSSMNAEAGSALAQLGGQTAFIKPELIALEVATLEGLMKSEPKLELYRHYFEEIRSQKAHVRSPEVEMLLAQVRDPLGSVNSISGAINDADMKFENIERDGVSVEVSHSSVGEFLCDTNPDVRRAAWENYADGHLGFQNSLAATLQASVKSYVFQSRARNYASSLTMSLERNHVPKQVFENLLSTFKEYQPVWHKYWALRKRAMNGRLRTSDAPIYDNPAPLVASTKVSFLQASEIILEGMKPLGLEYTEPMRKGLLEQRWVDYAQNQGKGAGAYSSGAKGTHPFIFMSWTDDLYSLSTLAHELGHSMHSYFSNATQPFVYTNYSMFVAEVASNFNQAMVRSHLLKTAHDKTSKLAILEEAFSNFHRYLFVMPTLAQLEREMYERVEAGGSINAPFLSERLVELFSQGYGGAVEIDVPRLGASWMNFGHLYAPFYVYQYATGIAAANALAKDVLEQGEPAAKRYLEFLKLGSSKYPLDALKLAGIDMNSPEPVRRGFEVLKSMVDELERVIES
jgi:oligoendopeptidase F